MNKLGMYVSAVGNHQFDEGQAELRRMQRGGCHHAAAVDLELAAVLGLEFPHGGLDVAVDHVGVLPRRVLERGRGHVLGQDVDAVGHRIAGTVLGQ